LSYSPNPVFDSTKPASLPPVTIINA